MQGCATPGVYAKDKSFELLTSTLDMISILPFFLHGTLKLLHRYSFLSPRSSYSLVIIT